MDLRDKIFISILLVLCFTMVVSADPQQFLDTVRKTYVNKTSELMSSFLTTVTRELRAAKDKHFLIDSCQDDFVNSMEKDIDPILAKMTACYLYNTSCKAAENCYKKTLTELKKKAHDLHTTVKNCIQVKCAAHYYPYKCI